MLGGSRELTKSGQVNHPVVTEGRREIGTAAGIVVVSRTTDGCFLHRCSRLLFGVLACRQRRRVIDECHFLVCHSSVVASVFAPDARVITAKSFQPMMSLRCPTAARPVLDVEHVDGLADGNESRKKGSSEDVRSNPLSSDAFASTHRRRHWSTSSMIFARLRGGTGPSIRMYLPSK